MDMKKSHGSHPYIHIFTPRMASRWRVWDFELKDFLPNISEHIYDEPIRIEQPERMCHYLPTSLVELVVSEANKRSILECHVGNGVGYRNDYDIEPKMPDTDTHNNSDNYSDTISCTSLIGEVSSTSLGNTQRPISSSCPNLSFEDYSPPRLTMKGVKTERIEKGKGRATVLKQRAIKAIALNQQTVATEKAIGRGRAKIRSVK